MTMTPNEIELLKLVAAKAQKDIDFWHAARGKLAKLAELQEGGDEALLLRHCAAVAERAVEDLAPLVKLSRWGECTTRALMFFVGGIELSIHAGADDAA
jgi:hypothetical protein